MSSGEEDGSSPQNMSPYTIELDDNKSKKIYAEVNNSMQQTVKHQLGKLEVD
jgi:hypothetical protein